MTRLQLRKKAIYPGLQVGVRLQGGGQASLVNVQGAQRGVRGVRLQLLSNQLGDEARRERHGVLLGLDWLSCSRLSQIWRRRMHVCRHTCIRTQSITLYLTIAWRQAAGHMYMYHSYHGNIGQSRAGVKGVPGCVYTDLQGAYCLASTK